MTFPQSIRPLAFIALAALSGAAARADGSTELVVINTSAEVVTVGPSRLSAIGVGTSGRLSVTPKIDPIPARYFVVEPGEAIPKMVLPAGATLVLDFQETSITGLGFRRVLDLEVNGDLIATLTYQLDALRVPYTLDGSGWTPLDEALRAEGISTHLCRSA